MTLLIRSDRKHVVRGWVAKFGRSNVIPGTGILLHLALPRAFSSFDGQFTQSAPALTLYKPLPKRRLSAADQQCTEGQGFDKLTAFIRPSND
jgi:hypothetical protein